MLDNEAKRTLAACRALDATLVKYLDGTMPLYKIAGECERCLEDIVLLLNAAVHAQGLSHKLLRQQGVNPGILGQFEEMVDHVLRTNKAKHSSHKESNGEGKGR